MSQSTKVIPRANLKQLADSLHLEGRCLVTTNGCFDILHVGHLRTLARARALGDVLIVGLNSDASVKRLKGPERPLNNEADRAEMLAGLNCVDYVSIFDEDTPVEFVKLVRPNLHVKGADYKPEDLAETPVVEASGGRIVILDMVPGRSTSATVSKIRSTNR